MTPTALTVDRVKRRDTRAQRAAFSKVRLAERAYATKLRMIARHVGELVRGLVEHDEDVDLTAIETALADYAKLLTPWARRAARRTIAEIARRDEVAWERYARHLGVELRAQLQTAPLGAVVARLQEEQVKLITSLPLEASRRVQEIARGTLYTSARPRELMTEILRTGEVTKSRATLIARTETAKAASILTRARATHVGSEGYVWTAVLDADTRDSHRHMNGKFVRWDDPPEVEPGRRYHAGEFCNCRCWVNPVLPEE